MKFEINQIVEIVDDKPIILSTQIRVLTPSVDLYSLARDYIEEYADYEFVQRHQYSGYRIKNNKHRRYTIVLIPQQDRLIICSQQQTQITSKLFPYLWETVINSIEELRYFFELWNHQDHEEAKA